MNQNEFDEAVKTQVKSSAIERGIELSAEEAVSMYQQIKADISGTVLTEEQEASINESMEGKGACREFAICVYKAIDKSVEQVTKEMGVTLT